MDTCVNIALWEGYVDKCRKSTFIKLSIQDMYIYVGLATMHQ